MPAVPDLPDHDHVTGPGTAGLLASTRMALRHRLAASQAECRLPSVVGGVVHDGRIAWTAGAGTVDGATPSSDTRYRIGSITKTLTAVLVLQLRDEHRLALDDRLDDHVPGTPLGDRTIASLLSHTSGLQAETAGPWWERTQGGPLDELTAPLTEAAVLAPEGRRHHYSNLGYGLLGGVIERHRGMSWMDAIQAHLLDPLEMAATSYGPQAPHAAGFAVHPWADVVLPEPSAIHDAASMAPAGQLWCSIVDLCTWGRFLAGDAGDVIDADTLEEMCAPIALSDTDGWTVGHGLGVQVFRSRERTWVGHGGSMPGFLAALLVDQAEQAASAVMANTTAGIDAVATDLLHLVIDHQPRLPEAWAPDPDVPMDLLDALGPWYWGPTPVSLQWTDGYLRMVRLVDRGRESRFIPDGDDAWRGLDGYYAGETLRIVRDDAGRPHHLDLATFIFTRTPYDPDAPVPGGVDSEWTP